MKREKKSIDVLNVVICAVGVLYVLITIVSLCWGVVGSFMPSRAFDYEPTKFPDRFDPENYEKVWKEFYVLVAKVHKTYWIEDLFFNGLVYALGCSAVSVLVCSLTAYMAAQYDFKFSAFLCGAVLFTMSFPTIGTTVGELAILKFFNLYDTLLGVLVLKANFTGMYFFVFYATFKNVPKSYAEAARMDGAGHASILFKIYYPIAFNAILTVVLLYFIQYWNDYQTPLIFLPSMPTVSYGLFLYNNRGGAEAPFTTHKLAASILVLLPVLTVFLIFQKRLIGKISLSGGVKE